MTPAQRKKLNEDRAKLKGYRNRLMILKDVVPNINELWQDNGKMVKFFESGQAAKYEANPTKLVDKKPIGLKVTTDLTPEKYRELKAQGVNDSEIKEQYKLHSNSMNAWKKANGLMGIKSDGERATHKDKSIKNESGVVELKLTIKKYEEWKGKGLTDKQIADRLGVTVGSVYQFKSKNGLTDPKQKAEPTEVKKEEIDFSKSIEADYKARITTLNLKNQQLEESLADSEEECKDLEDTAKIAIKAQKQAMDELKEAQENLNEANLKIKGLDAESEQLKHWNSTISEQLDLAQRAERTALNELIQYQSDYRKLEVDYRNQSTEVNRLKAMLDKLKHTEQINVWLMKQHVGFMEQADDVAGGFGR